jgi:hypothetical protein
MEDLKAEALREAQKSPLNAMMGIKHIDDEGKTVVTRPAEHYPRSHPTIGTSI